MILYIVVDVINEGVCELLAYFMLLLMLLMMEYVNYWLIYCCCCSMVKEGVEDLKRRASDNGNYNYCSMSIIHLLCDQYNTETNNCIAKILQKPNMEDIELDDGVIRQQPVEIPYHKDEKEYLQEVEWSNIRVGDYLYIGNNDDIAADVVLLTSSDENGVVYIETSNIDGETNLKIKSCSLYGLDQDVGVSEYSSPYDIQR